MKIFLDTVDLDAIQIWQERGLLDGVTTNPTLLATSGKDVNQLIHKICASLPNGLISIEVTETNTADLLQQARRIASLGKNVLVKIPCVLDYYPVIKTLANEGVQINVTLLFSLPQALFMAKLGAAFISPFVGRLQDQDLPSIELLKQLRVIMDANANSTKILAASIRDETQFSQAILTGVDAITIPPALLQNLTYHPLTEQGIARFSNDWNSLHIKKPFP